jgi:hypothetical protein
MMQSELHQVAKRKLYGKGPVDPEIMDIIKKEVTLAVSLCQTIIIHVLSQSLKKGETEIMYM